MKIDAHQHFWRYEPAAYPWIGAHMQALRRDFLPADLAPLLQASGFDACIAVQARTSIEDTRVLLELADAHPFVAGVVGWVDLCAPDARDQIARYADHPKLVGLRHIVQDEPDDRFLLRDDFCRGVALLEAFDLTYDILVFPRQLPAAIEFVGRFPRHRFVLDHLAKPDLRDGRIDTWAKDLERLAAFPHVCAKISGLVTEADWAAWRPADLHRAIDVAWRCFGPSRLMIGSDWPVCTLAADYATTMGVGTAYLAGRPAGEREAVLGGTAARFWRLDGGRTTAS